MQRDIFHSFGAPVCVYYTVLLGYSTHAVKYTHLSGLARTRMVGCRICITQVG